MSEVSIFGKKWTDLVFEGRNKSYGAYQLRNENGRTTLTALFFGVMLMGALGGGGLLLSSFGKKPVILPSPEPPTIVTVSKLLPPTPPTPPAPKKITAPAASNPDLKNLSNPVIVSRDEHPDDIAPNNTPVAPDPAPGNDTPSTGVATSPAPAATGNAVVPNDRPVRPGALDVLPTFPGGIDKFYKYVGNNFEKPEFDEGVKLTVLVAFVIEIDGSLSDIRVVENPGRGLDKEAIRVLKSLRTKWRPGIKDGKPVRTLYSLPITVTQ